MKTLFIILKRQWFDMTDSGEKPEEYRDLTPFWVKRLIDINAPEEQKGENKVIPDNIVFDIIENGHDPDLVLKSYYSSFKKFDQVFARNGYNPKNRSWRRKWEGVHIGEGRPEWGAEPGKKYFVIKLGDKIEPNYKQS